VTDSSTGHRRQLRLLRTLGALAFAGPITGCISYSPAQVSAMSAYDLCELENFQRVNLTSASKAALEQELKRRNENCAGLMPQIVHDREDDRLDRMYNRQSP
jgi:hypothetical protein